MFALWHWSLGPKAIAYMELFFGGLAKPQLQHKAIRLTKSFSLIQPETCGHMKQTDSRNNIDKAPVE